MASSMQSEASSFRPSKAWAQAKSDMNKRLRYLAAPLDRDAFKLEVMMGMASAGWPVRTKIRPRCNNPHAFQSAAPFSSANATSSSINAAALNLRVLDIAVIQVLLQRPHIELSNRRWVKFLARDGQLFLVARLFPCQPATPCGGGWFAGIARCER